MLLETSQVKNKHIICLSLASGVRPEGVPGEYTTYPLVPGKLPLLTKEKKRKRKSVLK